MEKQETGGRTARARKEFDWKGMGLQLGAAALQGVAFALGGAAVQRLTRGTARRVTLADGQDNILSLKQGRQA